MSERVKTGKQISQEIAEIIVEHIWSLSDRELRLARKRFESLTETNCWFAEYYLRDFAIGEINRCIQSRTFDRRRTAGIATAAKRILRAKNDQTSQGPPDIAEDVPCPSVPGNEGTR